MASYEIAVKLNTDSALDGLRKITDSITLIEVKANTVFTNIGNLMSKTFNAGLRVGNSMFNGLVSGIQKLGSFFRSILGEAINLFKKMETAALAAVVAISYGTGKAVTAAASRQREFSMLDRVGTSQAERSQLRSIGLQPGGSISGSYQSYARLRDMGMDSGLSMGLVGGMTRLAGRTGASPDETNRAITALMQMKSKGKVTGEELRGQLMEALPAASGIIKSQFGTTNIDELTKIPIDTFIQKFVKGLNDLAPATFTAFDAIKNLKQGIQELIISFGEGFMGGDFTQKLGSFNDILEALQPTAKKLGEGLRFVVDWLVQFGQKVYQNKEVIVDWITNGWKKMVDWISSGWSKITGWLDKAKKFLSDNGFITAFKGIGKAIGEMFSKMSSKDNIDAMVRGFSLIAESVRGIAEAMLKIPFDQLVKTFNKLLEVFNSMPKEAIAGLMTLGLVNNMPGGKTTTGKGAYLAGMAGYNPVVGAGLGFLGGAVAGGGGGGGGGLLGNLISGLIGGGVVAAALPPGVSDLGKSGWRLPGYNVGVKTLVDGTEKVVAQPKGGLLNRAARWFGTGEVREGWGGKFAGSVEGANPGPLGKLTLFWRNLFKFADRSGLDEVYHSGTTESSMRAFPKIAATLRFLNNIFKVLAVVDIGQNIYSSSTGGQSWKTGLGNIARTGSMFIPGPIGLGSAIGQAAIGIGYAPVYRALYGGVSEKVAGEAAGSSTRRIQVGRGSTTNPFQPDKPQYLEKQYKGFYEMYGPARQSYVDKQNYEEYLAKDLKRRNAWGAVQAAKLNLVAGVPGSGMDPYLMVPSKDRKSLYDQLQDKTLSKADMAAVRARAQSYRETHNTYGFGGGGVPGWNNNFTPLGFPEFNPGQMASGAMDVAKQVGNVSMTHTIDLSPQTQEFVASVTSPAAAQSLNTHMNQWITQVATTQRI